MSFFHLSFLHLPPKRNHIGLGTLLFAADWFCVMISRPAARLTRLLRSSSLPGASTYSPELLVVWHARSAASTSRWKQRQGRDSFARDAKVQGLKSRAAFKLLEVCCDVGGSVDASCCVR